MLQILVEQIGFPRPMNLREMLAPTEKSFTNLRNLIWFVKVVRKAYSGRRREAENGVSFAPLLNRLLSRALGGPTPWTDDSLISLFS